MLRSFSNPTTRKLVLRFVMDHVDFRKRSLYLQEIIRMGKKEDCWRQALLAFLDTPFHTEPLRKEPCLN